MPNDATTDAGPHTGPQTGPPAGPLAGVRVLEIAGLGPGPFAAMLLADLGADVVRVDRPGGSALSGDPALDVTNRGKRSVVLDLKTPEGVARTLDLAARADLLIEGFRPGVAERLGLGPAHCLARNPALVYGRMTGWGQEGPLAQSAGHDIGYIATAGVLGLVGPADGPPAIPVNLLGDYAGGSLYLVVGLLAALHHARATGTGQVVDAAIVDGAAHLTSVLWGFMAGGRWHDRRGVNIIDGGAPFYAVYETSDGRHMAVGALEPQFFAEFVKLLELPPDAPGQRDLARWDELRTLITERFATRTQAEWSALFEGTDACVAPVLTLHEAADHPHLRARASYGSHDGLLQPGPAPRFSATPNPAPRPPALPDAHRASVAVDWDVPSLTAEA
ncbi:CaiB/BaiF CoA transferase family protein [Streptacidiphilus anmyonensis]|uniref:CaiB/BaiF CoA transferase family protein n=1 Tax=Streptacidiphilus anmyonensis TaxID=405782 RepID=UPI00157BA08F|nr:CaiB/BaiF CoA-transferase family protein [Streptacidiphilus anmyonensis]